MSLEKGTELANEEKGHRRKVRQDLLQGLLDEQLSERHELLKKKAKLVTEEKFTRMPPRHNTTEVKKRIRGDRKRSPVQKVLKKEKEELKTTSKPKRNRTDRSA